MNNQSRVGIIIKFLLVKIVVFFGFDFVLVLSPKRNLRVQDLVINFRDVLALFFRVGNFFAHFHNDWVADVVAVFFNKLLNFVLLKIL